MQDLKALTDDELLAKKRAATSSEERARVRFNKTRSSADGQKYQRARERAGALRTEVRLRGLDSK